MSITPICRACEKEGHLGHWIDHALWITTLLVGPFFATNQTCPLQVRILPPSRMERLEGQGKQLN